MASIYLHDLLCDFEIEKISLTMQIVIDHIAEGRDNHPKNGKLFKFSTRNGQKDFQLLPRVKGNLIPTKIPRNFLLIIKALIQ